MKRRAFTAMVLVASISMSGVALAEAPKPRPRPAPSQNVVRVENIRKDFEDKQKDLEAQDKMGNFQIQ